MIPSKPAQNSAPRRRRQGEQLSGAGVARVVRIISGLGWRGRGADMSCSPRTHSFFCADGRNQAGWILDKIPDSFLIAFSLFVWVAVEMSCRDQNHLPVYEPRGSPTGDPSHCGPFSESAGADGCCLMYCRRECWTP
eukprot:gene17975-biopygen9915